MLLPTVAAAVLRPFTGPRPRAWRAHGPIAMLLHGMMFSTRCISRGAGCAFVTYRTRESAELAMSELHGKRTITGVPHPVQCKLANSEMAAGACVALRHPWLVLLCAIFTRDIFLRVVAWRLQWPTPVDWAQWWSLVAALLLLHPQVRVVLSAGPHVPCPGVTCCLGRCCSEQQAVRGHVGTRHERGALAAVVQGVWQCRGDHCAAPQVRGR